MSGVPKPACAPGEWSVLPDPFANAIIATAKDGHTTYLGSAGDLANARMFAAASAMYDALVECLAIARRNEAGDHIGRAEAALALARGEQFGFLAVKDVLAEADILKAGAP